MKADLIVCVAAALGGMTCALMGDYTGFCLCVLSMVVHYRGIAS